MVSEGLLSAQEVTCGGTTYGLANSDSGCGVHGPVLVYTRGGKQNTCSALRENRCRAQLQVVSRS